MKQAVVADDGRSPNGWQARLDLHFAPRAGRTALVARSHEGPLLVQRPFHPEGETCHCYVVHPPGGVVGGDRLDVRVQAYTGASVLLTTPAAGKFYRGGGREARQDVRIDASCAAVEWLPQEAIFYPDAMVRSTTALHLDAGSRMIAWELVCCGLPARNEAFSSGQLRLGLEVWLGDRPLLLDRLHIDGQGRAGTAQWGLAGMPVFGTMLAYPVTKPDLERLREIDFHCEDEFVPGLTLVDGLLVCRALDLHADALKRRFTAIWQRLRPLLLGREAVAPRIWAT